MSVKQYEIFLVCLDPAIGHEIKKTRPCVIVSPDEMNDNIATVIIAPITSQSHPYPTRVPLKFQGKEGWVVLDQIRTVDRKRLIKKIGKLDTDVLRKVKSVFKEMLVD
jgi:mRNA interferase MazF